MSNEPARIALPVLLSTLLLAAACGRDSGAPRHVFFVTVDTLRADHLSTYGYPRSTSPYLDRLASQGVLFERAIAQWPKTGTSFASIFTGQYPQTTGITHEAAVRLPDEYLTLPELFAELGFTTAAVVSNGVLSRELGWHQGFDEYLETWKLAPEPSSDPVEYRKYLNARKVNELALPMLERHKDAERLFVWLHYSDPHAPYLLPEGVENPFLDDPWYTGDRMVPRDKVRGKFLLGGERELRYYVAQYDANVHFTDRHVEEALEHARALGLLDDALVIFTADHGESLGEHGYYFGHGRLPHDPGSRVPLVLAGRGVPNEARRVAAPVELLDLYPTLLSLLAPDRPLPLLEGDSLLPLLRGGDEEAVRETFRYAFAQAGGGSPTTHFRFVQDEDWKLVYHPGWRKKGEGKRGPPIYELYDLEQDPGELDNLFEENNPEFRRLHRELSGWMKGIHWIRRPRSEIKAHSEETLKTLEALGYINN